MSTSPSVWQEDPESTVHGASTEGYNVSSHLRATLIA